MNKKRRRTTAMDRAAEIVLNAGGFRECGSLQADIERAILDAIEDCAKIAESSGECVCGGMKSRLHDEDCPFMACYLVAQKIRNMGSTK